MSQDAAHGCASHGKKRPSSSGSLAEDFECAVCYDLLLDPVVAPCGHDMCLHCYQRWSSANGAAAVCPLCRCTLPSNLAVCLRLKKTIERFHPEATERRRQEVQDGAQSKANLSPDPEPLPQQQLPTYPPDLVAQWTATFLPQHQHSFFSNMMVAVQYMRRQQQSPTPPSPTSPAASEQEESEASTDPSTLACDGNMFYSMMPCWTNFTGSSAPGSVDPMTACMPRNVPTAQRTQKRTWQTAADSAIRLEMARAIISTLQARGWHHTLGAKLADAVRFLELFLYRTAASREFYINTSDLEARIVAAVQQRAAAACARRARLGVDSDAQSVQQAVRS